MEPERPGSEDSNPRGKKLKRREILEKKKAVSKLIGAACSDPDHLPSFPHLRHYCKNGLSVVFESGRGVRLSSCTKQYIQNLLKTNMEGPYGHEWPEEEKVKRREMSAPEALYIFVHESTDVRANGKLVDTSLVEKTAGQKGSMVGFVHYRFIVEDELPVLYVYESQLEHRVQGKGLGEFLMKLIELIACKVQCRKLTAA